MELTISITLHPSTTKVASLAVEMLEELLAQIVEGQPSQFEGPPRMTITKNYITVNPRDAQPYPLRVGATVKAMS